MSHKKQVSRSSWPFTLLLYQLFEKVDDIIKVPRALNKKNDIYYVKNSIPYYVSQARVHVYSSFSVSQTLETCNSFTNM